MHWWIISPHGLLTCVSICFFATVQWNALHLHQLLLLLLPNHLALCYHGDGVPLLALAHHFCTNLMQSICDGLCGNVAAEYMALVAACHLVTGYVGKISAREQKQLMMMIINTISVWFCILVSNHMTWHTETESVENTFIYTKIYWGMRRHFTREWGWLDCPCIQIFANWQSIMT